MHRRPVLAALALAAALSAGAAAPAWAVDGEQPASSDLAVQATVNGRDLSRVDANDPLRLEPAEEAVVEVDVTNTGSAPATVRSVRLDGRVVGLTFFTFTTRVDLVVPPGQTGQRRYAVDLGDLGEQATGLVPARLVLLDPDRTEVVAAEFPVDVRGSMMSVYGIFALGIAVATALLLLGLVLRLVAGLLPANRWSRAVRFAWPGAGLGLTVAFTASALRIAVPSPRVAAALVVIGTVAGFVAGYLSPQRAALAEDLDERDLVAPPPPRPTPTPSEERPVRPTDTGLALLGSPDRETLAPPSGPAPTGQAPPVTLPPPPHAAVTLPGQPIPLPQPAPDRDSRSTLPPVASKDGRTL